MSSISVHHFSCWRRKGEVESVCKGERVDVATKALRHAAKNEKFTKEERKRRKLMLIFVNNNEKLAPLRWKLSLKSNFTRDKARRSPGDRRNIEKTIIDKTAEMTKSAMQMPRQFLFSDDDEPSSCWKDRKKWKTRTLNFCGEEEGRRWKKMGRKS